MDILEKYVTRGRQTASRIYEGTAIVVLLPRGSHEPEEEIFELSPLGSHLWKLLENRPKVRELIDHFAKQKRVSRKSAAKKIVAFIKKLAADKIVDVVDEVGGD